MKLRNKKTGYVDNWCIDKDVIRTCDGSIVYNSLSELNEEWEDYEEPQEYWYLDIDGVIAVNAWDFDDNTVKGMRSIGNHFESKEEAEKAVEKLKAWKRLKDMKPKIRILSTTATYRETIYSVDFGFTDGDSDEIYKDINLLFGGEQ